MTNLRAWRQKSEQSLEDGSAATGLTKGYLSEIERGLVWPGAHVIAQIKKWTNGAVTANDIFDGLDMSLFATKPIRTGSVRSAVKGSTAKGRSHGKVKSFKENRPVAR